MSDERKQNQRSLRRYPLAAPVSVLDRLSQLSLGRLVNIHREGFMVMGAYLFENERLYQLQLQLTEPVNGRDTIALGVDCLWSRSDDSQMHWAGFKIIDASDEALQDIDVLVSSYALDQGDFLEKP